jgi:hypothetical protein
MNFTMSSYNDNDLQRLGEILAEQITSEFKLGFEAIGAIKQQVAILPALEAKVDALTLDMRVVKAAVTDTNQDQRRLEKRVDKLELTAHSHA